MLVALLLCLELSASASPAQQGGAARHAESAPEPRVELVRGLLALANWANQNELFLQRDLVWRSVIGLDPENAEARKGLRFTRDGNGHWKDPPARETKDRKPALLPELERRRSELVAAWRTQALAALDAQHADAAQRAACYAEILRVDPEDAVVHGLRGEVHGEKGWLLSETLAAAARRAELEACVQAARASVPKLESASASAEDCGYLPAWKFAHVSNGLRLLSQTSEAESLELAGNAHAVRELLTAVCGKKIAPSPGFSAYVLADPAECERFAAAVQGSTEADRKLWRAATGFGIPHRASVVAWDADAHKRLDCFTRHFLANCLFATYGIEARSGWIVDGLGICLAQRLTGTRLTWFRPDRADEDHALRLRMLDPKTSWMEEAQKLAAGNAAPKLADVLRKPVGELSLEDLLFSTAFSDYLVEGEPKSLPEILDRIGRGGTAPETIENVCARPFPEIEARFLRWLGEYR